MSDSRLIANELSGTAYLFERFPSFTQTFCFREVLEVRRQSGDVPVFSIRRPTDEPRQDFPAELSEITNYLPDSFDEILRGSAAFRKRARRAIGELKRLWGDESEKRRIYEALWLAPVMKRRGIRHVHVHFAGIAARTAWWLRRLAGVRYSFTAHANDIFCDEPRDRLEMLVRDAEFVVSVSDFSVGYLRGMFPQSSAKIHRVYNGIHLDRFRLTEPSTERPLILSVGRYIEKKGFADLIAACGRIKERPFECLIVGQGPLEERLCKQVDELGLGGKVRITGPMPEGEVAELLARTSLFVLPCVESGDGGKDNLPTVVMEAMAAGIPVISTPVAGVPEMVIDGETGWLVAERDPDALARRMTEVLADGERAGAMGAAGRKLCEERFATGRTTGELLALFRRYAPRKRGELSFKFVSFKRLLGIS